MECTPISDPEVFPEIEKLRTALFGLSGKSRATAMIGSGFSRQAEALSPSAATFPLWGDLAKRMRKELRSTSESMEAPDLAEEYERRFGRVALDDLIFESVPDRDYAPGANHRRLLSLPWTDLFTTNYDTLLERTASNTIERRYETIYTAADLTLRAAPRIVKLHGSLPSHRPFVITRSDYTGYPTECAPFVNLVRQAVIENVFVLLGFSGDDPNFLEWSRWVHDQLGDHAPPIYLCGVLDAPPEVRARLQERRVKPVDLGPLFPKIQFPNGDARRLAAFTWFLQALAEAKPTRPMQWAARSTVEGGVLHPPTPPIKRFTSFDELWPHKETIDPDKVRSVVDVWRRQRQEYPGWILAPEEIRSRIWQYTKFWREPLVAQVDSLPVAEQLAMFRELIWRLDVCLISVWTPEADRIVRLLEQIDPFGDAKSGANAVTVEDGGRSVAEDWIELAFAVLRIAREDLDEARHQVWHGKLEKIGASWPHVLPRLYAERAYWELAVLDIEKLENHLKTWGATEQSPWGQAKIAALFAEIGQDERGLELAQSALREVRSRLGASRPKLELLSLEAWLIALTELLAGSFQGRTQATRDRLTELSREHCDPEATREHLAQKLQSAEPPRRPSESEHTGFDPGAKRRSVRASGGGVEFEDLIPAFSVLRLPEVAPCVISTERMTFLGHETAHAAVWLEPIAPYWAMGSLVRSKHDKAIDTFMDRAAVALYPRDRVARMFQMLLRLAKLSLGRVPNDPRAAQNDAICGMGAMSLELLSRLAFKLEASELSELLRVTIKWLHHDAAARSWVFDDEVDSLVKRVVFAVPAEELSTVALGLLDVPVVGENGFGERDHTHWPDPVEALFQRSDWCRKTPDVPETLVLRLAAVLRHGDGDATRRAAARLGWLHNQEWLTAQQTAAFENALWSRLDARKLPMHLGHTDPRRWFDWPGANARGVGMIARDALVVQPLPPVFEPDGKSIRSDTLSKIEDRFLQLRGLTGVLFPHPPTWSFQPVDAEILLTQIENWWEQNSTALVDIRDNKRWRFFSERQTPVHLISAMAGFWADGPLLSFKEDRPLISRVEGLLDRVATAGFDTSRAVVGRLGSSLIDVNFAADRVSVRLFSDRADDLSTGGWLVLAWYRANRKGLIADPPPVAVVELLAQRVALRTERGLETACHWLTVIVREFGIPASTRAAVMHTLSVLLEATDLRGWRKEFERGMTSRAEANHLIELRVNAAALAAALSVSDETHPVIQRWKSAAEGDSLPEVRRAWQPSRPD